MWRLPQKTFLWVSVCNMASQMESSRKTVESFYTYICLRISWKSNKKNMRKNIKRQQTNRSWVGQIFCFSLPVIQGLSIRFFFKASLLNILNTAWGPRLWLWECQEIFRVEVAELRERIQRQCLKVGLDRDLKKSLYIQLQIHTGQSHVIYVTAPKNLLPCTVEPALSAGLMWWRKAACHSQVHVAECCIHFVIEYIY